MCVARCVWFVVCCLSNVAICLLVVVRIVVDCYVLSVVCGLLLFVVCCVLSLLCVFVVFFLCVLCLCHCSLRVGC